MNFDFDLKRIFNLIRFEFIEILKNTIVPASCFILSVVLFFIFVSPFQRYSSNFDSLEQSLSSEIDILKKNKDLVVKARTSSVELQKVSDQLITYVSTNPNPALVSGILQELALKNNFTNVDENRNIEGSEQNLIQVRFNGRAPGLTTTANFLNQIDASKDSLYAVFNLDISGISGDTEFTRVSFTTQTIYDTSKNISDFLTPIPDVLSSQSYSRFRGKLNNQ
jgi:hypothetical protein